MKNLPTQGGGEPQPAGVAVTLASEAERRPLGEVLRSSGLLTEEDLTSALADQECTGRRLGEILVDRGILPDSLVRHALTEQAQGGLELEGGFGGGLRRALVLRHRRSDEDSLEAEQASLVEEAPTVLMEAAIEDLTDIADGLSVAMEPEPVPQPNPSGGRKLGEVLVARGFLTKKQVRDALVEQERSGRRLGEILVALGMVPRPVVGDALTEQHHGEVALECGFGSGLRAALLEPRAHAG
jgi:hypothetical protein